MNVCQLKQSIVWIHASGTANAGRASSFCRRPFEDGETWVVHGWSSIFSFPPKPIANSWSMQQPRTLTPEVLPAFLEAPFFSHRDIRLVLKHCNVTYVKRLTRYASSGPGKWLSVSQRYPHEGPALQHEPSSLPQEHWWHLPQPTRMH